MHDVLREIAGYSYHRKEIGRAIIWNIFVRSLIPNGSHPVLISIPIHENGLIALAKCSLSLWKHDTPNSA